MTRRSLRSRPIPIQSQGDAVESRMEPLSRRRPRSPACRRHGRHHRRPRRLRHVHGPLRHVLGCRWRQAYGLPGGEGLFSRCARALAAASPRRARPQGWRSRHARPADDVSVTPWRRARQVRSAANIAIGRFGHPRPPAIACDHEQRADDRQVLQRVDQRLARCRAASDSRNRGNRTSPARRR